MFENLVSKLEPYLNKVKSSIIKSVLFIVYFVGLAFSILAALIINRDILFKDQRSDIYWEDAANYDQNLEELKRQS